MYILSKSSCDGKQLLDRKQKGLTQLEIQLTKEFFKNSDANSYQHVMSPDWNIQHIHMPFIPGESDLPLEYISYPNFTSIFLNVCALAQKCAMYYNHDVSIIIHTNIPIKTLKYLPESLEKIKNIFKLAITQCPNIIFSIENGALYSTRNSDIWINPNSFDGNVQWANYLNQELKTNRFKTTIDICHLLMTRKATEFLTMNKDTAYLEKTLLWFFKQNKNTINNIHLNNIHLLGLKGDHSETFNESDCRDMEILIDVFELYKQHDLKCNITLEVEELDYNDAKKAYALNQLICKKFKDYIQLS